MFSVQVLLHIPSGTGIAAYGLLNRYGVAVGEVAGTSLCPDGCAVIWEAYEPSLLGELERPFSSVAYATNENLQIVGTVTPLNSNGTPGLVQAVIWNSLGGPATLLPSPGPQYVQSFAYAVNDAGQVVGGAAESGDEGRIAVEWNGLTPTVLTPPAGYTGGSQAVGINTSGLVVGTSYSGKSGSPEAVVWRGTTATLLPKLQPSQGGSVLAASKALAVNDEGLVVGTAATASGGTVAVAWENGEVTNLGALGSGGLSAAAAVNDVGVIVGFSATVDNDPHRAVLWSRIGAEPQDLNTLISAADAAEFILTGATGIDASCDIVANGFNRTTGIRAAFILTLIEQSSCHTGL
jgi:probable HAF family extracellular repeat protein